MNKTENFVNHLEELVKKDDRATLARLRHSLAFPPGQYTQVFGFVERFTSSLFGWDREAYYLTAGLFATHPDQTEDETETLGATFRRVYYERGESESIAKRFLALIDADPEQISERLRHAINLIQSHNFAVNYDLLLSHLTAWNSEKKWVQQRWARDFYRPLETPAKPETTINPESE
jgi:CRISPR system Cascade subunit CasB